MPQEYLLSLSQLSWRSCSSILRTKNVFEYWNKSENNLNTLIEIVTWLTFWRRRWLQKSFVQAVEFFRWNDFPNWTFLTIFGFWTWIRSRIHLPLNHVIIKCYMQLIWYRKYHITQMMWLKGHVFLKAIL